MELMTTSKKDEHIIKAYCEYANKEFTMLSDYPARVEKDESPKYSTDFWSIVIDDYCKQFSLTLGKIKLGYSDFRAGFIAGLKHN